MTNNHAWRHIGSQSPVKHMHKVSQNGYQLCACPCLSLSPTLDLFMSQQSLWQCGVSSQREDITVLASTIVIVIMNQGGGQQV